MWYNSLIRWLLHSPLHGILSGSFMTIRYTGKKSGRKFEVPVNYLREAGAEILMTSSYRRRVWWRNLREGAPVRVWLQGREVPAHAEAVEDPDQVAAAFYEYFRIAPAQARFFGVTLDEKGEPDPETLAALSRERVMVRTQLS